jgi:serine O-acetyltransferase
MPESPSASPPAERGAPDPAPAEAAIPEDGPIQIAPAATVSALWEDLKMHTPERKGRHWTRYALHLAVAFFLSSGFHVCILYRFGAWFHRHRLRPLSIVSEKLIYHLYHCIIPCSARIGPALWIPHPLGIVLSSNARLGRYIFLRQGVQVVHVWEPGKSGVVGDRVRLNTNAMLIRGAMVAEDSIVAAGAVVNCYGPPRHMAVGVPARIKPLRPEQVRDESARSD